MTYLDPPQPIDEIRLQALKLSAEYVGSHERTADDIVAGARVFETYILEGK
ncbi:hypothetical protein ACIBHY_29935 [Nonomuraea sp. NPDC050547]|uniref:hypothetical protein n=1 Tax=Nonomuraea sp. NPDC050547 TaxID=3364368 RepID=UPI0037AFA726